MEAKTIIINGKKMLESDLAKMVAGKDKLADQAKRRRVKDKLILKKAIADGITVSDADIDAEIKKMA